MMPFGLKQKAKPNRLRRSMSMGFLSQKRKLHFKKVKRMEVPSESDAINFIHTSDAESWAKFLQTKLSSDDYRIQSYLHAPQEDSIPKIFSRNQTCAVLVSPCLLEQNFASFWNCCTNHFHNRTVILFLGVSTEELKSSLGAHLSEQVLTRHWLQVDGSKDSVTNALVKLIEVYELTENSPNESVVGQDQDDGESSIGHRDSSKSDDEETVYDYPPPPRQQNSILRIIPSSLYEQDSHEVFVILKRDAEDTITMVTESSSGPSRHIAMKSISSCVYSATIPSPFLGKVSFTLMAGDHCLGRASVFVHSRMEQLQAVLKKETSPLTLLCNAMGVPKTRTSEAEELDSLLAQRLAASQLPSSLMKVLSSEDQITSAEQESCHWPTLLHFAAEYNLTKTCEELLLYPGMIHAACTENNEGLFPCQLAEKKGFRALQKKLVQYVQDTKLRRSAADSGISFSETPPPAAHHSSSTHFYVNENPPPVDQCGPLADQCGPCDDDYIDMSSPVFLSRMGYGQPLLACQEVTKQELSLEEPPGKMLPPPGQCLTRLMGGYVKPRSFSEGCVKTPYARIPLEARIAEEEDSKENEPPPLKPKLRRAESEARRHFSSTYVPPIQRRPDSGGSDNSEDRESKVPENGSKSSTETLTQHTVEAGALGSSEQERRTSAEGARWYLDSQSESRPSSQVSSASSHSDYEVPLTNQGPYNDDAPVLRKEKRSRSVQDKISHFFKKIKTPRRFHSSSESDLPIVCKGHKKAVVYCRQSTASSSSDPSSCNSSGLRQSIASVQRENERDSGAVCDEHGSPVLLRSNPTCTRTSRNTGKRNGTSMQRRLSVRIQKARNQDPGETPILPARPSSKESFVSFIK